MDFATATKIINCDKTPKSKDEELDAYRIFFKGAFGVDIQNLDGTYKTLNSIFEEIRRTTK